MLKTKYSALTISGLLFISGCASLKEKCPDDPFDPDASGYCRLLYTKSDQQARINAESEQGAEIAAEGEGLKKEQELSIAELKAAKAEAAALRTELKAEEGRAAEAEARVLALQASGEKTAEELGAINARLEEVKTMLGTVNATNGSSPSDVEKLREIKSKLESELDALLDL